MYVRGDDCPCGRHVPTNRLPLDARDDGPAAGGDIPARASPSIGPAGDIARTSSSRLLVSDRSCERAGESGRRAFGLARLPADGNEISRRPAWAHIYGEIKGLGLV